MNRRNRMLAKKAFPNDKKTITRDKEAKINSIIGATRTLIEMMGYEKVTIRDIAGSAGVSVGLIYKYFPGGKFNILKEIGSRYTTDQLMIKQPDKIDFNDFSGYMRMVIKNMQQMFKETSSLTKALTVAALVDGEVIEEVKKVEAIDIKAISDFFCRFKGVDLCDKNLMEILVNWGFAIKGILFYHTLFPMMDEEALANLLINVSLKIWGYRENP
jgi:AcrR family transcriptional regulator